MISDDPGTHLARLGTVPQGAAVKEISLVRSAFVLHRHIPAGDAAPSIGIAVEAEDQPARYPAHNAVRSGHSHFDDTVPSKGRALRARGEGPDEARYHGRQSQHSSLPARELHYRRSQGT